LNAVDDADAVIQNCLRSGKCLMASLWKEIKAQAFAIYIAAPAERLR